MDEIKFTQGTILCSIRSDKYPTTRCYGIIISARCDIAQGKVDKIYLLTAIDAKEWINCWKLSKEHDYSPMGRSRITVLESMPFSISVVTYMELLQGMRNKQEMESMNIRLLGCHNHRPDRITLPANKTDDSISGTVYS